MKNSETHKEISKRDLTSQQKAAEEKKPELPKGSQLVSFGDRITYTFAYGKEVGSIHFDRGRGEIFYKGHNIRNMDVEEWQMQMMEQLRKILSGDENGKEFAASYGHTLDKIILDKKSKK